MAPRASRDYEADVPYIAPKSQKKGKRANIPDRYPFSGTYLGHNPWAGGAARARATPGRSFILGMGVGPEGIEGVSAPGTIGGIEDISAPGTIGGIEIRDIGSRR